MKSLTSLIVVLGATLSAPVVADHHMTQNMPMQDGMRQGMPGDTMMYGAELMTPKERAEYQTRMRTLTTEKEREAFRLEHHKLMQERARAQGRTLPDMPPKGMGPGSDMGPGMGPDSGLGPRP